MPVSRLAGLTGRFSSWRRKRKSIPAVAVADEDDDEEYDVDDVIDGKDTNATASSELAISREPRAETASSAAAQAESGIAAMRSDAGAKPLGEEVGVGTTANTPTAENVLVTDGQVAAGEVLLPSAESASDRGAEMSSNEKVSPIPVEALAVAIASDDSRAVKDSAAAHPLGTACSENEGKETSSESEKGPVAAVTTADPSDNLESAAALTGDDEPRAEKVEVAGEQGHSKTASSLAGSSPSDGASSDAGERAQANAKRADGTSLGGEAGEDTSREQHGPPSSTSMAAVAPSTGVESAATPRVDTDSHDKDALLGVPDVDTPKKERTPSTVGKPGESAAAAVNNAKETANTPTLPTAAESPARKQAAAEAAVPLESSELAADSAVPSTSSPSPNPTGTAPSPPSLPRNEARRKKQGSGDLAATKRLETPTKTEERRGLADDAGPTVSVEKPAAFPSKVTEDDAVAAVEEPVPRVADKSGAVGGSSGAAEGSSSAWNAINPAAEFLKDWVDKAVPKKKAELKRRESVVCWERQWCVTLGVVGSAVLCIGTLSLYSGTPLPLDGLMSVVEVCGCFHVRAFREEGISQFLSHLP